MASGPLRIPSALKPSPEPRSLLACLRVLALLLLATTLSGGVADPRGTFGFRSYGIEQGLTNLSVNSLAQDAQGFLWVGTEDGLFRLEGDEFRRFGTEHGLPDDSIGNNALGPTPDGGLWVVTQKGPALWDGSRFLQPSELGFAEWNGKAGLALPTGWLILNDGKHNRFLIRGREAPRALAALPKVGGMSGAWASQDGRELLVLVAGQLWRGLDDRWERMPAAPAFHGNPQSVRKDRNGIYWIRCERGILRAPSAQGPWEDVCGAGGLSTSDNSSLVEDPFGRMWANTASRLVWYRDREAGELAEAQGLPRGGGVVLLVDREGNLWVGGEGVHRLLGRFAWEGFTQREGLPAHAVWSILRRRDGTLLAGTPNGLAVAESRGWKPLPGTGQRLFSAMTEDPEGTLYAMPSLQAGEPPWLLALPRGSLVPTRISFNSLDPPAVPTSIASAGAGTLWYATSRGLYLAQRQHGGWKMTPEGIPGWPREKASINQVWARDGHLWVAGSLGLAAKVSGVWYTARKSTGLEDDEVLTLAPSGEEAWLSYRSVKALSRVRLDSGGFRVIETLRSPHPLVGQVVLSLLRDPSGGLWMGTAQGVIWWEGPRMERFGKGSGLPGVDCTQNGLWLDPGGDLWAGLSVGIAHFRNEFRAVPKGPPGVRIMEALDGAGRRLLPADGPSRVPYRDRTLSFAYLPVGQGVAEGTRFQVRLEGLEDDWRDTTIREARYPGLRPGSYRFEVRMKDWAGRTGPASGVDVRVGTPWWSSWWFTLLLIAGGLGALAAGVGWRTALLRRRNEELERIVQARTEALAQANFALQELSMGDPLTHLRNRRYLAITMPEEIARVLRVFQGLLQKGADPRQGNEDTVLLMVDMDHFKSVNDRFGHRAGDSVLEQTADILRAVCRESDTLVRWGGEEFLVLAKRTHRRNGELIAKNILEAIGAKAFVLPEGETIHCTCCVGFTAFPVLPGEPDAFRWEEAIEIADQCLYAAKNSGRNAWVGTYSGTLRGSEGLRPAVLADISTVIASGDFTLRTSLPDPRRISWKEYLA
ncbi:MAG: diguanylate cyclase [Acidobacteria bacterium]|nr:diguanylate cyclase [Acidobacteriota bacterium]